jgi:antitoxin YefM
MAITTSEARRDLFNLIERVNLDHTEVEITSKRGSAVLMSKDEYDSLVETSYLLRSPVNAQRLLSALNSAREGKVVERELPPASEPEPLPAPEIVAGGWTILPHGCQVVWRDPLPGGENIVGSWRVRTREEQGEVRPGATWI